MVPFKGQNTQKRVLSLLYTVKILSILRKIGRPRSMKLITQAVRHLDGRFPYDSFFKIMDHLKLTVNQRGGRKLSHDGHVYTVKKTLKTLIRWECSHRRKFDCLGALRTNVEVTEIIGCVEHSEFCEPQIHLAAKAEARQQLKSEALSYRGATKRCIAKVLDPLPVAVRSEIDKGESSLMLLCFHSVY